MKNWTLLALVVLQGFATAAQVKINTYADFQKLEKPGYRLLFEDDFTVFDSTVWDKSCPGNDDWNYGQPEICTSLNSRNAPKNPSNILPPTPEGWLPLQVRRGEDRAACQFSSAEIKTFKNDDSTQTFRDWRIYPNSYIEVRAKYPDCAGVTGAAWIYGPSDGNYFEIDFLEGFGKRASEFQTNFHFGKPGRMKSDPQVVKLADSLGRPLRLADQFLTYAVQIEDHGAAEIFVNDSPVGKKIQRRNGIMPRRWKRVQPAFLRIGTGSSTLDGWRVADCEQLPSIFWVDFVRVWQREGTRAVQMHLGTSAEISLHKNLDWNDGAGFAVTYYPKARYDWSAHPEFDISQHGHERDDEFNYFWISLRPDTPTGEYDLSLTVSFSSGYVEILPCKIVVF